MDIAALAPIIVALVTGGAVTFYTARPRKNTLIAEAADKAVDVVTKAIDRQEAQIRQQAEDLRSARERIAALETQLRNSIEAVNALRREVRRLGGDVEQINGRIGEADDDR